MTGRVAAAVFPTLTEPLPSREQLRAAVGPADWEALFERPIGETVGERLGDELLAGVALTDALIGTFAAADGEDLLANRCFLYHVIGRGSGEWLVPVGGMGALTGELAAAALRAGAELRTGVEAVAIEAGEDEAEVLCEEDGCEIRLNARRVLFGAAPFELGAPDGRCRRGAARGLPAEGQPAARAPAAPARAGTRSRARVRGHVPRERDRLAAAARLREGGCRRAPRSASLRGVLPFAHRPVDPVGRSARGRSPHAHALRAAHPRPPLRRRARGACASARSPRRSPRSTASSPSRWRSACCATATAARASRHAARLISRTSCACRAGTSSTATLSWPFAEDEADVGTWGVETELAPVLLCGAGARRGGGVSGIPGRNAAMAVLRAPSACR